MFVGHLCIFFGETSIQILCLLFHWVICYLFVLKNCRGSLQILDWGKGSKSEALHRGMKKLLGEMDMFIDLTVVMVSPIYQN